MGNKTEMLVSNKSALGNVASWLFGVLIFAIGLLNLFWGNDQGFGVFLILMSFIYFPPINTMISERLGFGIPVIIKVLLGVFLLWASLGVAELFAEIDIMMKDLG